MVNDWIVAIEFEIMIFAPLIAVYVFCLKFRMLCMLDFTMFFTYAKRKLNNLIDNSKRIKKQKCNTKNQNSKGAKSDQKTKFKEEQLVVVILSILLVLIVNISSIFGYIFYQEWTLFEAILLKDFPLPCSNLSLNPDEDYITFDLSKGDLKTYVDDKGNYICRKNNLTETIKTIVERICRIQLALGKEKRYLSCGNESLRETSGYQTLFFREIVKRQNSSDTKPADDKLHWNRHPNKYYIDKSIHYHNGEVTIPEGRDYYLYTSIHFNISRQNINGQKWRQQSQRITVRLCKSVHGYEQTLQARSELFNITHTKNVVGSLRVETYANLRRNDKIYVRVNDASKIIHSSKGNTFGMFPL